MGQVADFEKTAAEMQVQSLQLNRLRQSDVTLRIQTSFLASSTAVLANGLRVGSAAGITLLLLHLALGLLRVVARHGANDVLHRAKDEAFKSSTCCQRRETDWGLHRTWSKTGGHGRSGLVCLTLAVPTTESTAPCT